MILRERSQDKVVRLNPLYPNISMHILHTVPGFYRFADKESFFNNQVVL